MNMDTPDNYYAILGVPIDADSEMLKRTYRQLARRFHPDLAGPEGAVQMKRINRAYDVLSDPEKRLNYDTITGGVIAHHSQPDRILKPALARAAEVCMSPASPGTVTDHDYVLAAAGLLLSLDADLAARVLSRALGLSSLPARPLTMASPAPSKGTA